MAQARVSRKWTDVLHGFARGGGGRTVNSDDLRKLKFRLGCDSSSEPTFEGTLTGEEWKKGDSKPAADNKRYLELLFYGFN